MASRYLVTGGCGSVGSALVEKLLKEGNTVCSLDINENGLFLQSQILTNIYPDKYKPFIGDIRDFQRILKAMNNVEYVYHCAALKHVKLSEYNPFEAIKTNVDGTNNVLNAAISCDVKAVVVTSSDKAVNPSSTMGATKLLAERVSIDANSSVGNNKIKISVVRFGNIWNSAGSVGPIFKNQCLDNKDITLTSKDMTRFFITMEKSLQLCEFAMKNMVGGEIFIANMGTLNICDLANSFINYYSSKSNIKLIGIQPGEKLYEELYTEQEATRVGSYGGYLIVLPENIYLKKCINFWKNNPKFDFLEGNSALVSDQKVNLIDPIYLVKNI